MGAHDFDRLDSVSNTDNHYGLRPGSGFASMSCMIPRLVVRVTCCLLAWVHGGLAVDGIEARQLIVKFKDGLHFRAQGGKLTNAIPEELAPLLPLLDSLPKAHWRRVDKISEAQMESIRQAAQNKLGRALPDLNQQFRVFLPANTNADGVIDALNLLAVVELAQPVPIPSLPVAPNFRPLQGYLDLPPVGVGAACAQTNCDRRGGMIKVCDIEYRDTSASRNIPCDAAHRTFAQPKNGVDPGDPTQGISQHTGGMDHHLGRVRISRKRPDDWPNAHLSSGGSGCGGQHLPFGSRERPCRWREVLPRPLALTNRRVDSETARRYSRCRR